MVNVSSLELLAIHSKRQLLLVDKQPMESNCRGENSIELIESTLQLLRYRKC